MHGDGMQPTNINNFTMGGLVHEMLHAAGFWHTQSRADRNTYVTVYMDRINPKFKENFDMHTRTWSEWWHGTGNGSVGPYDVQAIMHYGSCFFRKNKVDPCSKKTAAILTKDGEMIKMNREKLRKKDIKAINGVYS